MQNRLATITREVKKYDRELYADLLPSGIPAVFRKTVRYETYVLDESEKSTLVVLKESPHLVFPLTDNWSVKGHMVDWGIEPILARLKAMDLWNNESFMDDLINSYEKAEEGRAKEKRNDIESFFYEMHGQFKKDWKDINTATINKKDRRIVDEKRIKGV